MVEKQQAVKHNVVERLYQAFRAGDGQAMEDCYAVDARFRDEVFDLTGRDEIGAMWKMLLARGTDLAVEVRSVSGDGATASAAWAADYTFGDTGRKVHNEIDAEFVIRDGLIVDHFDKFDFWKWSRQALGPAGTLLGWSPWLRQKVQDQARRGLDTWLLRGV